jgi:hypothetical protein
VHHHTWLSKWYFLFFLFVLEVYCGIYKSSYNVSNIS